MKIGVIGCGAIGSVLCRFIDKELKEHKLIAICDIDKDKAQKLKRLLKSKPITTTTDNLIQKSDLVIEAVSPKIVKNLLKECIKQKKHLMVMSVGGIIGNEHLLKRLKARLFIPSGAICGIDGVKAANIEKITSATITTTKNPKRLEDAPYIIKNKINLRNIKKKTTIFQGSALQAIEGFPRNVNVSATLSLAGIGPRKTKVKIIADPNVMTNTHEIEVIGTFGKMTAKIENVPSIKNPKTSHMAILSACATLKRLTSNVIIGN
ncbi:MAG: aspartate dehydrogenase [Nanoarchaeota archaeon]